MLRLDPGSMEQGGQQCVNFSAIRLKDFHAQRLKYHSHSLPLIHCQMEISFQALL